MIEPVNKFLNIKNGQIGLMLDNCAVQSANESLKCMKENKISAYFISPYCPELAPIEKYFSIFKQSILNIRMLNLVILNRNKGNELKMQ